jgi:hypothetical protein
MVTKRLPANDPRTIARDIPGLFDALFPQLVPGFVANLNRQSIQVPECEAVSSDLVSASSLQKAMLFEVAVAAAEKLITDHGAVEWDACLSIALHAVEWDACLSIALQRQRKHFDAKLTSHLSAIDKEVSLRVATNLVAMLRHLQSKSTGEPLVHAPEVPGHQWIASGVGDFALGQDLIEVKCTNKRFSSADYRQIVMYWLLSYAAAVEVGGHEWIGGILVNPRLNLILKFKFDDLIEIISAGKSKVELVRIFSSIIESHF